MVELVFGQREAETGKQRDDEEHDQRIAQREQETGYHVAQVVIALVDVLFNLADRVVEDHVNSVGNQNHAADDLKDVDVVGDEFGHERDAQTNQQAIEQVAGGSTHTGEEPRVTPLVQGTLDA